MFVPFHDTDAGPVPSQFEGYAELDELDWAGYRAEHTNIQRLDRILKAEGDDPDLAARTIDYYDQRTSHGSTLSLITYAGVLAGLDPASSWQRFLQALDSDLGDVQGGTTKEGIHMGVMSGTLDLLQRSYVGSSVRDGVLHFQPRLIDRLDG